MLLLVPSGQNTTSSKKENNYAPIIGTPAPILGEIAGVSGDAPLGPEARGVLGTNKFNGTMGFLAGPQSGRRFPAIGAYGESGGKGIGVLGFATTSQGIGVAGGSLHGQGIAGVQGHTRTEIGIWGTSEGPALASKFQGDVEVTGDQTVGTRGHDIHGRWDGCLTS